MSATKHRILGVDPGLNVTGYAILDSPGKGVSLVEAGVIRAGKGDVAKRVAEIHRGLTDLIEEYGPHVMALEELYSHVARPRTAILMGHARGVICLAAAQAGVPVVSYAATQIKRILTGAGRAPKSQVQQAVCRELGLATVPDPPDVADALAIAICHHYLSKSSLNTDASLR
ncbi:crossover junction endodeoxyribonuclease RuvC [Thermostilla marina]